MVEIHRGSFDMSQLGMLISTHRLEIEKVILKNLYTKSK
jgi:hypothetical protein